MPAPRVEELALAASEYVRQSLGVELDGSVESLAYVDHYLSKIGGVGNEVLALVAAALGSYFGEVMISHLGGAWQASDEDPAAWTITVEVAPITFHPVALAACAIRQDDLPDWDSSLRVPPELSAPLADALSATAPVAADYYYSLTGRCETIEHMAALLAELRHRADEEGKDGGENDDEEPSIH